MARKREELNASNVLEFCNRTVEDDQVDDSCARVDSVLPQTGHVRQTRVANPVGPQTDQDYMDTKVDPLEKSMKKRETDENPKNNQDLPTTINERFNNLESKLLEEGKPIPKTVYDRLKMLEDRMLYLEGMSPEYFTIKNKKNTENNAVKTEKMEVEQDNKESLSELNLKIQSLQQTLRANVKTENNE